jgi:NTE family protein
LKKPGIRLALGGGGFRGLAHIGALAAFGEAFEIEGVVGTSMGAIVGGLFAVGRSPAEVLELAHSLRFSKFAALFAPDLSIQGIGGTLGMTQYFTELTGGGRIEECKIPFIAVSYDLHARITVLHEAGDLALAMRASASLPVVFRPVCYHHHVLVDGGIEVPLPVRFLSELPGNGPTAAVNVLSQVRLEPTRIALEADRFQHQPRKKLTGVALETLRCNQGFLAMRALELFPPDIVVHASFELRRLSDLLQVDDLYRLGYDSAREAIRVWRESQEGSVG